MRTRELIEFFNFDTLNSKKYSECYNHILNYDGLMTSYDAKEKKYVDRYFLYSKNRKELDSLRKSISSFIINLSNMLSSINSESDVPVENYLGYIKNNACVNLRVHPSISKITLYRYLEKLTEKIFQGNTRISISKESDAFRVLRSKIKPTIDKDGNEKKHTVLIVVSLMSNIMDAFVKEQEFAEDLYGYTKKNNTFHFKNSKIIFDVLKIPIHEEEIYVLNERSKRISVDNPFSFGQFNFLSRGNSVGIEVGGRIADVAVYDKKKNPTYFSVKSFGRDKFSKAHLTSLKLDHPSIFSDKDYCMGLFMNGILGSKYKKAADIYTETDGNKIEICKYILENYEKLPEDCEYLNNFVEIFDRLTKTEKLNSIIKFLESPIFTYWGINPFLFVNSFLTYDRSLPKIKRFSCNDIFENLTDDSVMDQKNIFSLNCIENFIHNAFGTGYILVAIKDRFLHIKDYRQFTLSPFDYKIEEYRVCYPNRTRNAVELRIRTKTLTIIGEIYPAKCKWPNNLSFFYYYNDFDEFFNDIPKDQNPLIEEGYLINKGFKFKRPEYDLFLKG